MKTLIFILVFVLPYSINAQYQRNPYCDCKIKGTKIIDSLIGEKVSLDATYSGKNIHVKIVNNTQDTIFVFSSYFDNEISDSKYLYRYDKKSNKINISYAPLLPYLFTKYSDKIILEDRIIKDYQVVYNFYKIPANYEYTFIIKAMDFLNTEEFIKDFDVRKLNKFKKIEVFKTEKLKKANPIYSLSIAYYKNVETLCNSNSYYQEELKFNDAAKDFKLLQCLVNINFQNKE